MLEAGSLIRSLSGRPAARNFHTFVINEIGHAIVTGQFPVGSVLASDQVMMERYGVSRTVLREALKTLEAKGLVEARPKVGTKVSHRSRWAFLDPQVLAWHFDAPPDPQFHDSLFRTRAAMEPPIIELSARRRTAEHVRLMKYWLHQMTTAGDSREQFGLGCLEIHGAIADSAQDPLLRGVLGVIELTLALALTRNATLAGREYRERACACYEAAIVAIETGNGPGALEALAACRSLERGQVVGPA